jgi:hypothetical protein
MSGVYFSVSSVDPVFQRDDIRYHFPSPVIGRRCGEPVEPDARVGVQPGKKKHHHLHRKISPTPPLLWIPFFNGMTAENYTFLIPDNMIIPPSGDDENRK